MTASDLTARVTRDGCALGVALAAPAAWLGGADGAFGAVAGAALAVGNFRWLAARARAAAGHGTAARALWPLGTGLRLAGLAAVAAALLASGAAHPVALVVGLGVLPLAVVAHGLRAGREEA